MTSPRSLDTAAVERCREVIAAELAAPAPRFPGAVLAVADERDEAVSAHGLALRYRSLEEELPVDHRIAMSTGTIFDLASISKLFTTLLTIRQVERGRVELRSPVGDYLEEYDRDAVRGVTVEQLLTHTSGLPWWMPLWRDHPDPRSRLAAALAADPDTAPGSTYCYSDINLIVLGELLMRVAGRDLAALLTTEIAEPLGLADTGYRPAPALRARIAATEDERDASRGMVHGEVHDENAWSLGGVAGHAGVFATAADLVRLGRCLLGGGSLEGRRILQPDSVEAMMTDATARLGVHHGLGFEIDQPSFMGGLAGPHTVGHTGFTGTSLVIDYDRRLIVVLLTNRVHPSRDRGSIHPVRAAIGDALA